MNFIFLSKIGQYFAAFRLYFEYIYSLDKYDRFIAFASPEYLQPENRYFSQVSWASFFLEIDHDFSVKQLPKFI